MILMHRDIPAAKVIFVDNYPARILEIYDKNELPLGVLGDNDLQTKLLLKRWYDNRIIPNIRPNRKIIENLIGMSIPEAISNSFALSLIDSFWFKPEDFEVSYYDINYHDNGFVPLCNNILFNKRVSDFNTPDLTTDGVMIKYWIPSGDQPYLIKIDDKHQNLLTANEVVYYNVAKHYIETVRYCKGKTDNIYYCNCPCFTKNNSEDFISAMQIKHSDFSLTGELLYEWFKDYPIKTMVTLDCIFHNTDRHEKNFGIIRDKKGNCRFAPLFDNGSCLGYNVPTIVNNDMKILQGERKDILERFGEDIEIDEQYAKNVLQSVYEFYNIPEKLYERSLKELEYGINLNNQRNKESGRDPYI